MGDKTTGNPEKLLNTKETAAAVGLTASFLTKAKNQYGLPHYKIGGSVRFKLSEVVSWLNQRKVC